MSGDERELRAAWDRHVGTGTDAAAWFDTVLGRHRDPERHYHGVRHVRWVVRHGRELAATTDPTLPSDQVDRVVAAAFFHDAVYDATSGDNEPASARLATRALGEMAWAGPAIKHVASMIEATAGHDLSDNDDVATSILVAADLAVLAAEPARYDDYTRAVRREYRHLDDDAWRTGRAAFVASTLQRERIFPARLELDEWERRARANLTAEFAALS